MDLSLLLTILLSALKVITLYFAGVFLLYGWRKPAAIPRAEARTRFAVVIAARNEETVIPRLVESLRRQNYPRELFDIYAVPNNCRDNTAGAAFQAGAEVLLCTGTVKNKGDALRQAFAQLRAEQYDAYVVFDADNVADPEFLARMNDAFCAGARVAKGRQLAGNPGDSWVAGCYDVYFRAFDRFFNRPRACGGLSAKLVGTGFALRREVLEEVLGGWSTETLAEDAEAAAQCALAGERVFWVPQAVTWDEEPLTLRNSLRQRRRWCSGILSVSRRMLPRFFRGEGSALRLDMSLFLLTPYAQGAGALLGLGLGAWKLLTGGVQAWAFMLGGGTLAYGVMAALAFVLSAQRGKKRWQAALSFPLFMATWAPLQILALFHRTRVWKEIPHAGLARPADLA